MARIFVSLGAIAAAGTGIILCAEASAGDTLETPLLMGSAAATLALLSYGIPAVKASRVGTMEGKILRQKADNIVGDTRRQCATYCPRLRARLQKAGVSLETMPNYGTWSKLPEAGPEASNVATAVKDLRPAIALVEDCYNGPISPPFLLANFFETQPEIPYLCASTPKP